MSADRLNLSDTLNPLKHLAPISEASKRYCLSQAEDRIKRLKTELPPAPYQLELLHSDRPYTVSEVQANDWRSRSQWPRGHPFGKKERCLQYMSFLQHEWDDGLVRPVGNWDDGSGGIMEENNTPMERFPSGPGTPLMGQTAKKKTQLGEYLKRKDKNAEFSALSGLSKTNGEPRNTAKVEEKAKEVKVSGQTENGDKANAPVEALSPISQLEAIERKEKALADQVVSKKRPLENVNESTLDIHTTKTKTPRPEKKPRLGSPIRESQPKPSPNMEAVNMDLPPDISPSLPPSLTEDLPQLISPTLPPSLEAELKNLPLNPNNPNGVLGHKKALSVTSATSEGKVQKSPLALPATSPKPKTSTSLLAHGTKEPSKIISSPIIKTEKPGAVLGKTHRPSDSDVSQKSTQAVSSKPISAKEQERPKEPKNEKRKTLVKLKYGRKNRTAISRILRIGPRPKRAVDDASSKKPREQDPTRSQVPKDVKAEDRRKSPLPQADKRPRPVDAEEPPSKRHKAPSGLNLTEKPRTPVPPPFRSPALSKSQFSTPKKDLKSVAMRRVDSGDGDARTPSGARSGTPTAPNSIERGSSVTKHSPQNAANDENYNSRQQQKEFWRADQRLYNDLAKSLKRKTDEILKAREDSSMEDKRLAVITGLETIFSFFLSFFANDQALSVSMGRPTVDAMTWTTINQYWRFINGQAQAFPDLHGLCLQIGALSRETMCNGRIERLASDPFPKGSGDGISPPSEQGQLSPSSAKEAATRSAFLENKAKIVSDFHMARSLWIDGARSLSLQKIQSDYPLTWAMQEMDSSIRGREKPQPGKYNGKFFLPLSQISTPVEGVRFGMSFLKEYCKAEAVDWQPKLSFDVAVLDKH